MKKPKVVIVRGYGSNPWELNPLSLLEDEFDIKYLLPQNKYHDTTQIKLQSIKAHTLRDLFPRGRLGDIAGYVLGDRYFRFSKHLEDADIVHSIELDTWFSKQAAQYRTKYGYKLAISVWETIPFHGTYRHFLRSRGNRKQMLNAADLYLPATQRARKTLLLEGVLEKKIEVCEPGIAGYSETDQPEAEKEGAYASANSQNEHVVISIGRLVWEKGHQDVIRAVAALHNGLVAAPVKPKLVIVGSGPEKKRLKNYCTELGIEDFVDFAGVRSHREIYRLHKQSSCLVLASLPSPKWEEQFGYVIPEALSSGLSVICSSSGAIPEVLENQGALFTPGDWIGLAERLATGPLADDPAVRKIPDPSHMNKFLQESHAERLRQAYRGLLA